MREITVHKVAHFNIVVYHPGKFIENAQYICVMFPLVLRFHLSLPFCSLLELWK